MIHTTYKQKQTEILKKLVADRYFPVSKTGEKLKLIDEAAQQLDALMLELISKNEPDDFMRPITKALNTFRGGLRHIITGKDAA